MLLFEIFELCIVCCKMQKVEMDAETLASMMDDVAALLPGALRVCTLPDWTHMFSLQYDSG